MMLLDRLDREYPDPSRLRNMIDKVGAMSGAKSIKMQDLSLIYQLIICHAVAQLKQTIQGAEWWALYIPGDDPFKPRVILEKIP